MAAYETLTSSAAIFDRSRTSRIEHAGKDALDLLHRLSTNDLTCLPKGAAVRTVVTSDRGRIVGVITVVGVEPDRLLLLSDAADARPIVEWVDKFTFEEDSRLRDVSGELAQLAVAGLRAGDVVRKLAGDAAAALERGGCCRSAVLGVEADVVRSDAPGIPCWELIVPAQARDSLLAAAARSGAALGDEAAWDAVRIERGVPVSGHELTEDANPLEAGLRGLVSFTKGCYVGQEVVARLDAYEKVRRVLTGLLSDAPLRPGELLSAGGQLAGNVTSAAWSPGLRRHVGLGYVRNAFAAPGTQFVAGPGAVTVAALPMVS
jgi:folate-binding protein YgfZ